MRALFILLRVGGAAVITTAIVGQLTNVVDYWDEQGLSHQSSTIVNFFSFFTIDSNLLTVVVFLWGAWRLVRRLDDSPRFGLFRGCVATYMIITGTVYNLLLRDVELAEGLAQPWSNEIVHVVGPLLVAIDWLFAPGRCRLEWRHLTTILAFPVVWIVYTLVRGPHVESEVTGTVYWYPYPFLNPNEFATGYWGVAFFIALIGVAFVAFSALVVWVSRRWAAPTAAAS